MKKFHLKNGLIVYESTAAEITLIGGLGICDECNLREPIGYLIPVLNHWMCKSCFEDWKTRARHYPEDDYIEKRNADYYERFIPLTETEETEV